MRSINGAVLVIAAMLIPAIVYVALNGLQRKPKPQPPAHIHAILQCHECRDLWEVIDTRANVAAIRPGWMCPECTMPDGFDPTDAELGGHAPYRAASRARDLAHRNTTEDET